MALFQSVLSQTDLFGGEAKSTSFQSSSCANASQSTPIVVTRSSAADSGSIFGQPTSQNLFAPTQSIQQQQQQQQRHQQRHTAMVFGSQAAQPVAKKSRQNRSVVWHPTVKQNDGLRHDTDMFHEHMRDVFRQVRRANGETVVSILARNRNVLGLVQLQKMLTDLIGRCRRSPCGRAVILNRGGGSAGSITTQHIPYLIAHVKYLEDVIQKVRAHIANLQRQQQQQQQQRF